MRVSELIAELKNMPKDAEVYYCKTYEEDEDGRVDDIYELVSVDEHEWTTATGWDDEDIHEVFLIFNTKTPSQNSMLHNIF